MLTCTLFRFSFGTLSNSNAISFANSWFLGSLEDTQPNSTLLNVLIPTCTYYISKVPPISCINKRIHNVLLWNLRFLVKQQWPQCRYFLGNRRLRRLSFQSNLHLKYFSSLSLSSKKSFFERKYRVLKKIKK